MNEFFKRMLGSIKTLWGKWTNVQKLIFGGIAAAVVTGFILLATFSTSSDMVPLFAAPINDLMQLEKISNRLDKEGITNQVTENSVLLENEKVVKRARAILFRENLVPKSISPWDVFNTGSKWTVTDDETQVKVQQAITKTVEQHLESLDEIINAQVILTFPEITILRSSQNKKKASVIISPRRTDDITISVIQGIENLVLYAVDGLEKENLKITDTSGKLLNSNDDALDADWKMKTAKRQMEYKLELQNTYLTLLREQLESIYPNRVVIANVELDLDFDTESYTEVQLKPTILEEDNPMTFVNERKYVEKITTMEEDKRLIYVGTGIHPEGPAGVEGQVSDGYKDQTGAISESDDTHTVKTSRVSEKNIDVKKAPIELKSFSVGIFLDGLWKTKRSATGEKQVSETGGIDRIFVPVSPEEVKSVENVIKASVNFDLKAGDKVSVVPLQFDRSKEHEIEDEAFMRRKMYLMLGLISAACLVFVLVMAFVIRAIIRTREQMKRRREEELARKQAALREAALRRAEEDSVSMQMSVGSKNMEDEEIAKQITRENPEDVAHLIRTWLVEE